MREFPLEKAFQWFEPGPVVLVSTAHRGKANIMTMSWHMVVEFSPQIACVVSPGNHTFAALRATRECVISIPGADLARTVVDIGNCSGREVDKFAAFGLTALPASSVRAPLIAECLAGLECRVADTRLVGKYSLFVLDGVKAWTNPRRKNRKTFHAVGDGTFVVDGRALNLKKRMTKWPEFI
ncbi:flavin reductase [Termitidicoccus mucosus]|uniref:Flavin reductase n=1 Tax=Termitidicoccus mucosus TaxID=1184151 RepID=A0A178INS9_9BACT|nr:flavin reductase [Opitutaceae bacterium TSB47]